MRPPNTIYFSFSLCLTQSICLFLACHSVLLPRLARSLRVINANLRCIHRSGHFEVCQPGTSCCPLPSPLSLALFLWLISNFSHAGGCSSSNDDNFRLPFILGVGERQTNCRRGVSFVCSLYWPPSSVRLSSCPSVRLSDCPVVRPTRLPVRVVRSDAKAAAFELCRRRSRKFHQLLRKFSFFSSRFSLCLSLSLSRVFVLLISAVWRGHLPTRCAFSARNAGGRHAAVSLTPTRAPALPLCMPSHKSRTEQAAQTATLAIRASFACSPCVGLCLRLHLPVRLWMELLLR